MARVVVTLKGDLRRHAPGQGSEPYHDSASPAEDVKGITKDGKEETPATNAKRQIGQRQPSASTRAARRAE